jgi:hypothetical protein
MEVECSYRHVTISTDGKRLFGVCIVYACTRKILELVKNLCSVSVCSTVCKLFTTERDSSLAESFRPLYDPGVNLASSRNEYQGYLLGGKVGLCVGMTTLPPSCADCLEILGASASWNPKGLSSPVKVQFCIYVLCWQVDFFCTNYLVCFTNLTCHPERNIR